MQPYIFVRHDGKNKQIEFQDILYIEAKKNFTKIFFKERPPIVILAPLKRWNEILPPDMFCRIHRRYVVSIDQIKSFDNHYVYFSKEAIPIGDQYRSELFNKVKIVGLDSLTQPTDTIRKSVRERNGMTSVLP